MLSKNFWLNYHYQQSVTKHSITVLKSYHSVLQMTYLITHVLNHLIFLRKLSLKLSVLYHHLSPHKLRIEFLLSHRHVYLSLLSLFWVVRKKTWLRSSLTDFWWKPTSRFFWSGLKMNNSVISMNRPFSLIIFKHLNILINELFPSLC